MFLEIGFTRLCVVLLPTERILRMQNIGVEPMITEVIRPKLLSYSDTDMVLSLEVTAPFTAPLLTRDNQ